MVNILDVCDEEFPIKIKVGKAEVDAYPLSLSDIFYLFRRYPPLLKALTDATELTPELVGSLVAASPDILADVIAASQHDKDGNGLRGNPEAIKKAKRLPATDQLAAANSIIRASFEGGFGPFDQQLAELLAMFVTKKAPEAQPSESTSLRVTTAELVGTPPPMRRRRPPGSSMPSTSSSSSSTTGESPTMPRPPAPPEPPSSTTSIAG